MAPWESFKVFFGLLVSDDVPGAEGEELGMAIFDVSRAHFMAPMDREACVELPQEDKLPEDCDAVGLLIAGFVQQAQTGKKIGKQRFNKLGTRLVWQAPLCSTTQKNDAEADDFVVVGSRRAWYQMGKTLSGKYSMRESHRLGFGNHCERHAELLNRIVSVGTNSDGWRYVRIEPDIRHAELVC